MLSIPARRISFTKRSCSVSNSRSIRPFACGLCAAILRSPTPPALVQNASVLFSATVPPAAPEQTSGRYCSYRCNALKDVRSAATIPRKSASSLPWCRVGETGIETAGGVMDHRNQLTSRAALLQPTKRGAMLHSNSPRLAAAPATHGWSLRAARGGTTSWPSLSTSAASPGSPATPPGPVHGGQCGSEVRIALAQARQNLLLQPGRQLAVRWPTT